MPELNLEAARGVVARATFYAERTFKDGIRDPDQERRSAYNLIVYIAPELLAEVQRLQATVARVRKLAESMAAESPKPGPGGFIAESILTALDGSGA